MADKYNTIEYSKEDKIAIITFNRPDALNALNIEVLSELNNALTDIRDDDNVWVGIITGAGDRAFCAGADIPELQRDVAAVLDAGAKRIHADEIWKPFIAAINGFALGGGLEVAMECDIRIASEKARLGQPEVNLGFLPGYGGTQRLPRFVPRAIAAEMLLTGQYIGAEEAHRVGLVNKVVPLEELMPTAKAIAETMLKAGPLGIRAAKEAIIRGYSQPLAEGLKLEQEIANRVGKTEDFKEGTRAFLERKPPEFKAK